LSAAAGPGRGFTFCRDVVVEVFGDVASGCIADWPESADDVLVASEVEGTGDVDGFISETRAGDGGVTCGQVCQIAIQVQGTEARPA
jgi:hypothetical protein